MTASDCSSELDKINYTGRSPSQRVQHKLKGKYLILVDNQRKGIEMVSHLSYQSLQFLIRKRTVFMIEYNSKLNFSPNDLHFREESLSFDPFIDIEI